MIILSVVSFFIILALGVSETDVNSIFVEKNLFTKHDSDSIVKITGTLTSPLANMTVTFPGGNVVLSSVEITRSNSFSNFVYLQSDFESGVYTIHITPYDDDGIVSDGLVDYFVLVDDDGFVDVVIEKNAAQKCMYVTNQYGEKITNTDTCIHPKITHIPKTFAINFINMDYKTHKMDFGAFKSDLILPESSNVVFFDMTEVYNYSCMFHPWIDGIITVSDIPSLQHVITSSTGNEYESNNNDNSMYDLIIPSNDIIPYQYDTTCTDCYVGIVTKIVDGDTIHVDKKIIRLSLVDTPESRDPGFANATEYTAKTCPVGMLVLVDVDSLQPHDKFKRVMAKITCGDVNLNAALLSSGNAKVYSYFCAKSEFVTEQWAARGCGFDLNNNNESISELNNDTIPQENNTDNIIPINVISNDGKKQTAEVSLFLIIFVAVIVITMIVVVYFFRKPKSDFDVKYTADEDFEFID